MGRVIKSVYQKYQASLVFVRTTYLERKNKKGGCDGLVARQRAGEETHQATVTYDLLRSEGWTRKQHLNFTERLNELYLRAALGPLAGALVGGVDLVTSPSLVDVGTGRTGRLVLPSNVPTFTYASGAQLRDTLAADVAVARTTLSALDATKRLIAERRLSRRQALLDGNQASVPGGGGGGAISVVPIYFTAANTFCSTTATS